MKNKKIKILICLIVVLSITVIPACTNTSGNNNNDNTNNDNSNNGNENSANNNENDDEVSQGNPAQDVDLTEMLLADEEVLNGQIYLRNEWAIGAITLKDEVSVERVKEIAQEYAELIKEKYNDKRVNVQVILNGENVANIEL